MIRQRQLFGAPQYPWGDEAVNSLLVIRAEHFDLLIGNYSRVGFHHPGPALLYMLAGGETLFFRILHVVPTPYNGQLLGVSLYVVVFLALAAVSLLRLTRSTGAAVLAFSIAYLFAAHLLLFGQDWFPFLYMSAFMLFTVAAAGVAAGLTSELPLYVLAGGVLVHGHVSFIFFVTATTVVVVAGWSWCHRGAARPELSAHRKALIGSGVILALLLLPMVAEVIRHFPGPWVKYWAYIRAGSPSGRTLGEAVHFLGQYWTAIRLPVAVLVAAAALAILLTAFDRDRRRRRVFGGLYGMVLLQTVLTLYYVYRGVDVLQPDTAYVAYFYTTVPVVLIMAVTGQLWLRVRELLIRHTALPAAARAVPVLLVSAGLVLAAALGPSFASMPAAPNVGYQQAAASLAANPLRKDRTIALVQDDMAIWPHGAGIALQLDRTGVPWCIDGSGVPWDLLYSPDQLCDGTYGAWSVHLTASPPPPNADVLWQGTLVNRDLVTAYALPSGRG